MLAYRVYGVVKGDVTIIRWIAGDSRATDTAVGLVFVAVLVGTLRYGVTSPIHWLAASAVMSTVGLLFFSTVAWLIGRALEGSGTFRAFVRTGGYAIAPIALGVFSPAGMALGFAVAFVATAGVMRALHNITWSAGALTALFPTMVVLAAVASVAAQA